MYSVQDPPVPPTTKMPLPFINVIKTITYRQAQKLSSQSLDSMTLTITDVTQPWTEPSNTLRQVTLLWGCISVYFGHSHGWEGR